MVKAQISRSHVDAERLRAKRAELRHLPDELDVRRVPVGSTGLEYADAGAVYRRSHAVPIEAEICVRADRRASFLCRLQELGEAVVRAPKVNEHERCIGRHRRPLRAAAGEKKERRSMERSTPVFSVSRSCRAAISRGQTRPRQALGLHANRE